MKTAFLFTPDRREGGMSLIEILIGLAIALIASLTIFQVFTASGERNRSTVSGSDAQIAGTVALFQLERDIKQAGMGFGMIPPGGTEGGVAGCTVAAYNSALATPDFSFTLAPVQIINGAGGSPDQILVSYGNSSYFVTSRKFKPPSTTTSKILVRRDAFHNGDIVLLTNMGVDAASGRCALVEITDNTDPDGSFHHVQGAVYPHFPDGINRTASMNAAPGAATLVVATVDDQGYAYNLGPAPSRNLWQVTPAGAANSNMLVWRNTLLSDLVQPVTEGIANLQAEYGVDDGAAGAATANDGIISPTEWTINQPSDWKQLLAVRFALLARGQQYEKDVVTSNAPVWDNGARTFTMFNVDGTSDSSPNDANDWRHYRYRVYEAIVPLRNMLWGAAP